MPTFFNNITKTGLVIGLLSLTGCGLFGNKTDLSFIDKPAGLKQQVAYVPLQPVVYGFNSPINMCAGFDNTFYIVDSISDLRSNNGGGTKSIIYCYDEAGNRIGTYIAPDSVSISSVTQDRNLELLCTGRIRSKVSATNNSVYAFPAIFRLSSKVTNNGATLLDLNQAKIIKILKYPFFIREANTRLTSINTDSAFVTGIFLTQIGILPDNRYYVACASKFGIPTGLKTNFPNNCVMLCGSKDTNFSAVNISGINGVNNNSFFNLPTSLVTTAQPPQNLLLADGLKQDFMVASLDKNAELKFTYIDVLATDGGTTYSPRIFQPTTAGKSLGSLGTSNRLKAPRAITYTGDGTRYIFIADQDSILQFQASGWEGVNLPAGANYTQLPRVAFGGTGSDIYRFKSPRGLAYRNRILYVLDNGNKRVCRYKLSTDFQ